MLMLGKFVVWIFLVFWFWPYFLSLFDQPDEAWWRLIIYAGWGATAIFLPFAMMAAGIESIAKDIFKR